MSPFCGWEEDRLPGETPEWKHAPRNMCTVCFIVLLWLHYITRHRRLNVSQANLRRKSTWRWHKDTELNIEKQKLNLEALPFYNQPNWSHGLVSTKVFHIVSAVCWIVALNVLWISLQFQQRQLWQQPGQLESVHRCRRSAQSTRVSQWSFAWERAVSPVDKPWHCHFVCVTKAQLILP